MEKEKPNKLPRRRKTLWILFGVFLILMLAAAGLWIWQKNNIDAVVQYTQYTKEELEQQMEDNDRRTQELLEEALKNAQQIDRENGGETAELPDTPPDRAPTETDSPAPSASSAPSASPAQTEEPAKTEAPAQPEAPEQTEPTFEAQLQAIVDRVYALKEEYLAALDALQAEAVADYKAIPSANRTAKALASFVSRYISKGTALEKDCDKKMDAILAELKTLLQTYGQDLELVDAVKYTYAQEKSLKKAWYMSELERRGLI